TTSAPKKPLKKSASDFSRNPTRSNPMEVRGSSSRSRKLFTLLQQVLSRVSLSPHREEKRDFHVMYDTWSKPPLSKSTNCCIIKQLVAGALEHDDRANRTIFA